MEETKKITKDTNIAEIVSHWPEVTEIFMLYGLHCFSCGVAEFESIGEGAMAHGFDEKTIDMLLKDANDLIDELEKEKKEE